MTTDDTTRIMVKETAVSTIEILLEKAVQKGSSEEVEALRVLLDSSLKGEPERTYRGLPVRVFGDETYLIDKEMGRPIKIDSEKIPETYQGIFKVAHDYEKTADLIETSRRLVEEVKAKLSSEKKIHDALDSASSFNEPLQLRKNQCPSNVPLTLAGVYFLCETCEDQSFCLKERGKWEPPKE